MKIKPIETEYKGYKFRSRLEARWAVFFDACGVKWEYEPEGFDLGDGLYYLPDFRLNFTLFDGTKTILWVEVKGDMTPADEKKILKFIRAGCPLLVVGNIPEEDFLVDIAKKHKECWIYYNRPKLDYDGRIPSVPCVTKSGHFRLNFFYLDDSATNAAYNKARQARFDKKSHEPRVGFIKHCGFNADGYCYRSKDYANNEYIYGVSALVEGFEDVALESRSGDSWGFGKLNCLEKFIGYSADDSEIWIKVFE